MQSVAGSRRPPLSFAEQLDGFQRRVAGPDGYVRRVVVASERVGDTIIGSKVFKSNDEDSVDLGRIVSVGNGAFRVAWNDGSRTAEDKADYDIMEHDREHRQSAALSPDGQALMEDPGWEEDQGHHFLDVGPHDLVFGPRQYYWTVVDNETGDNIAQGTASSPEEARYRAVDSYDRLVLRGQGGD